MKHLIILAFIVYINSSSASVIWPGTSAPCNTTLTACADAIPRGEVIEIHTNGPIDQSLSTTNGVSVVAGDGFKPVFTSGNGIDISGTSPDELVISISGLTFTRGGITYNARGLFTDTSTQLNISNNHIIENTSQFSAIRVFNFGSHDLNINISYNQVNHYPSSTSSDRRGAIAIANGVNFGTPSSAEMTGRVYNNWVKTSGEETVGIGLYDVSNSSFDLDISSNVLTGGGLAAMYVQKIAGSTGISRLDFAHNAIYSNQIDLNYRGMMAEIADGTLEINAVNNTIISAFDGFNFQETDAGVLDVNLYNNIVAFSDAPIILNFYNLADSTIGINNNNNLFYGNNLADPDFIPGPEFVATDPMFKSATNGRLRAGSPAAEAGNSLFLFTVGSVPLIDADGLYRIKKGDGTPGGASVDIGAYETGDLRILDLFSNSASSVNTINNPAINSLSNAKLQVTHNWNPGSSSGVYNNSNFGVFKTSTTWNIFNQDFVEMNPGSAFNIWNPAPSVNNFIHTATDASGLSESSTEVDMSGLNNNPDAILSITQLWESAAGSVYNDNPIGAFYDGFQDKWRINNMNLADMPLNAKFNVYFQTASANAFVHQAVVENTFISITYIDHPLLNDTPCAQFQTTHVGLTINPHPTGVYYDQARNQWAIFNQNGDPMNNNSKFHIIVSAEQIAECSDVIFTNSFD